jgi:hypothetical protein
MEERDHIKCTPPPSSIKDGRYLRRFSQSEIKLFSHQNSSYNRNGAQKTEMFTLMKSAVKRKFPPYLKSCHEVGLIQSLIFICIYFKLLLFPSAIRGLSRLRNVQNRPGATTSYSMDTGGRTDKAWS